jgi:uncharacterized protein YukE
MPGGELNYPPEVPVMVSDMQKKVAEANAQMQTLATAVASLNDPSHSAAVASFNDVHHQWSKLMQEHNQVLNGIAGKTQQGYDDMLAYDRQAANQIQSV